MFLVAFILRVSIIGKYGFSEDEILKVYAVRDYQDLSFSTNAQLPALMKLVITISVMIFGESEFAIRLPNTIVAGLTVYPIYYIGKELYDKRVGYISAMLWVIDIPSIAFSTIVKEDSLFTFFWTMTIYFIILGTKNQKYYKYAGICLGLTMATKYTAVILLVQLLVLYILFKKTEYPELTFWTTMKAIVPVSLVAFFIANFPILLFDTWRTLYHHWILQDKIVPPRHGFIMMGNLFDSRPYYYLLLFFVLKITIPNLVALILGIISFVRRPQLSNHIVSIWILIPLIIYSFIPGYTRYLLVITPPLLILSSVGIVYLVESILWLIQLRIKLTTTKHDIITYSLVGLISLNSLIAGFVVSPYYRMYVNELTGDDHAGWYFPQDSVYDYMLKEAVEYINQQANQNAEVATHLPLVAEYYGRPDLSYEYILNLPENISLWKSGNYSISWVIVQDSRIYLENEAQIKNIRSFLSPEKVFTILNNDVIEIYNLINL